MPRAYGRRCRPGPTSRIGRINRRHDGPTVPTGPTVPDIRGPTQPPPTDDRRRLGEPRELDGLAVELVRRDQLERRGEALQAAVLQDHDAVAHVERAQPVGDD